MACKVNNCCFCCKLRTGAIIIGNLIVVGGIIYILKGIQAGTRSNELVPSILEGLLSLALGGLLLYGVMKRKANAVLWYVRLEIMSIILSLIIAVALSIIVGTSAELQEQLNELKPEIRAQVESATIVALVVAAAISITLRVYFLVCVYSYYLELKNDPGVGGIVLSVPQPYVTDAVPYAYQPNATIPQPSSKMPPSY